MTKKLIPEIVDKYLKKISLAVVLLKDGVV